MRDDNDNLKVAVGGLTGEPGGVDFHFDGSLGEDDLVPPGFLEGNGQRLLYTVVDDDLEQGSAADLTPKQELPGYLRNA